MPKKGKVKLQGKIERQGEVELIEPQIKIKLSVPVIAVYLKKGLTITQIANICNVSPQAVDQYIDRHSEALGPLIDRDDGLIAMKAKHLHDRAMDKLIEHVEHATQKEMVALNMISGTHFDKYRLGTNQSTANTSSWMHIINDTPV